MVSDHELCGRQCIKGTTCSTVGSYDINIYVARVVKGDDPLGRARQVGDDKADGRIKLAGRPLDFGDHPARLRPASGLIAEISIEPPNFIWWSSDRTLE